MITNHLKINKIKSLNATTALNMNALSKGAKVLRVHDVLPAMECISLHEKIKNSNE
jgi:dihydropteroate synthase